MSDYQANDTTIQELEQSRGRYECDEDLQNTNNLNISQQSSGLFDYQSEDTTLEATRPRNETEMTDVQQQQKEQKQKQDVQQNQQRNQNQQPPQYQTQQRSNQSITPQQNQAQQYQQQSAVQPNLSAYAPQQQPVSQYQQPQNQQYAQNQQSMIQIQSQQSQQPVQYQQQQQPYYQQPMQYQQQQNPYPPQQMAFQQYPVQQPQIIVQQPQIIKEIIQAPNYPTSANGFRNSVQVQCPFCNKVKYTIIEFVPGSTYWKYTIGLAVCCPILCWIPWCNEDYYDVKSYCGECSMEVGLAESHK